MTTSHSQLRMNLEGGRVHPETAARIAKARPGGQPLDNPLREALSGALGCDLGSVRVHAESAAADLADRLDATAFTVGTHIFFAPAAYDPDSPAGRALIAHEVAHVLQQSAGRVRGRHDGLTLLPPWHPTEHEADTLAAAALDVVDGKRRPPAPRRPAPLIADADATVVQRSAALFIEAACNRINPLTAESAELKPKNCHEALLGWLLTSLGYPRRWRLMRLAAETHGVGHPLQFQGDWMWNHIYQGRMRATPDSIGRLVMPGDILCSGVAGRPTHSMAVVGKPYDARLRRFEVLIRGFNNAGTFPGSGYMQYDAHDRDVADPAMWNMTGRHPGKFGPATADLFVVGYQNAARHAARAFPWENAEIPTRAGQRWHYNPVQGWRWY